MGLIIVKPNGTSADKIMPFIEQGLNAYTGDVSFFLSMSNGNHLIIGPFTSSSPSIKSMVGINDVVVAYFRDAFEQPNGVNKNPFLAKKVDNGFYGMISDTVVLPKKLRESPISFDEKKKLYLESLFDNPDKRVSLLNGDEKMFKSLNKQMLVLSDKIVIVKNGSINFYNKNLFYERNGIFFSKIYGMVFEEENPPSKIISAGTYNDSDKFFTALINLKHKIYFRPKKGLFDFDERMVIESFTKKTRVLTLVGNHGRKMSMISSFLKENFDIFSRKDLPY